MAIRLKEKILFIIIPFLIKVLLFLLGKSIRIKECGNIKLSPYQKKGERYIYAFWHSRILLSVYFFKNKSINVLVSMNKDGEYTSRIINKFGFGVIRGSTSRGGLKALIKLKNVLNKGFDIAITPDGPRGPKQKVQMGIIYLSKITGVPIAPFSFDADKKKVLNSWDNFIIPLPFSNSVFMWGEPVYVSRDANEKEMEKKRLELENKLNELTDEAKTLCG